jgi:hypothetical protein
MKPIEQALATLIGDREPTADEIAKFYKIKEVCGFSEHDSVWAILIAFGHFEILYGEIPKQIADQAQRLLAEHKIAMEKTAEASATHIKSNLVDSVSKAAREMSKEVIESAKTLAIADSRAKFLIGSSLSFGVATIMISLMCWGAYNIGVRSKAADIAWLNTQQGEAGRKFAEINDVNSMLSCATGQKRHEGNKTFCFPYNDKSKKVSGWRVE